MAANTSTAFRNQVMYSVYVRNHSEEGTFKAVEKDLDRIKGLGVDIIWLMPIHPIGKAARKGELGSPYAISNYREINPELGTLEDFKDLVNAIHSKGMKCIIDVVYNHTSPDSWLVENHPEFFYITPEGKRGNRVGDWSDIVDLEYGNKDLWDYQIETLKMWAQMVDGFRCDVAPLIPLEFWKRARKEVAEVNPDCFWLSESVEPEFIVELRSRGMTALSDAEIFQVFDSCYDYDIHKIFRSYMAGECPLSTYIDRVNMQEFIYPANYVKLRFLENHDQDRAADYIADKNALMNMTAFIYFQKGLTLIYGGQEAVNDRRPTLFDKDPVDWNTGLDISDLLRKLYEIKQNPVFANSTYKAKAYDESDMIVATHTSGEKKMVGIFRAKGKEAYVPVDLEDGIYYDLISEKDVEVESGMIFCDGQALIFEA